MEETSEAPGKIQTFDNMAVSTFRTCPKKYEFFIQKGIVPAETPEALGFGISLHSGREAYKTAISSGTEHMAAVDVGAAKFEEQWRKLVSPVIRYYRGGGSKRGLKNGLLLMKGYLLKYGQFGVSQYVEIPFATHLGASPIHGREVIVSGVVDEIVEYQGGVYVLDLKTTSYEPNQKYFEEYKLSNAMMGYCYAVSELTGKNVAGAIIHAVWVRSIHGDKPRRIKFDDHFRSEIITYDPERMAEWKDNTLCSVDDIEASRLRGHFVSSWGDACKAYGGCPYVPICKTPQSRQAPIILKEYVERKWDPLDRKEDGNKDAMVTSSPVSLDADVKAASTA